MRDGHHGHGHGSRSSGRLRRALPAAGVLAAVLGLAGCAASPPAEPAPSSSSGEARVMAASDADATAVAAALVFPGSAWELPGTEGLTLLAAETLLEGIRDPLAELGAVAAVRCGRAVFTFTLLAPPDRWSAALDLLVAGLFRPAPTEASLERARGRLVRTLSLDQANPAWQARLAARQALYGDTVATPWSGPPCGVPETLPLFRLSEVRAGAYRFAPRLAYVALVGPPGVELGAERLAARIPAESAPPVPSPRRVGPGRRYVERNTVTAWVGSAFPFGPGADVDALRFLAMVIEDAVGPDVSRPEVLAVHSEIERHGTGGALIVHGVVRPGAADGYAELVEAAVRSAAGSALPTAVWERVLRRYRGERLLEREPPEARAEAMARALALGEDPGSGWPDPGSLTPARVRAAAGSLGAPARTVVGPRTARGGVVP